MVTKLSTSQLVAFRVAIFRIGQMITCAYVIVVDMTFLRLVT